jgi:curli biogenesis system outer membrane secretion channel CsgG
MFFKALNGRRNLAVFALLLAVGCHKNSSGIPQPPKPYDVVTDVFVDNNTAIPSATTGIIINGPGEELAESKTAIILLNHGCQVMERSKLASIVGEQKLQLSGLVEEGQAIEVGKLAGVNAIFIGNITLSGQRTKFSVFPPGVGQEATNMAFTGKLIDVKTGKIIITGFSRFDDVPGVGLDQAVSWTVDGYFNKVFNK